MALIKVERTMLATSLVPLIWIAQEVVAARNKLKAGKQRKMVLAADVRFLQRRFEYSAKANFLNSVQKDIPVLTPNLSARISHMMGISRKEAGHHKLQNCTRLLWPIVSLLSRPCVLHIAMEDSSVGQWKEIIPHPNLLGFWTHL